MWFFAISANKELLMNPLIVARNKAERVMIEPSINSVRISVKIKQADEMETFLCDKFMRFLFQRAEHFVILRRKPIEVHACTIILCYCLYLIRFFLGI